MEISLTEVWLFVWAFGATALWMDARSDAKTARTILRHFIENKEVREQMLSEFEKFKKKVEAM
jgi:hypothetical protein